MKKQFHHHTKITKVHNQKGQLRKQTSSDHLNIPQEKALVQPLHKQSEPVSPDYSKSVGAVVVNAKKHILLIFQNKNKYWEFPKGKTEIDEREIDTLTRELFEETGIKDFEMVKGFRKSMHYEFRYKGRIIQRKVVYFLVMTRSRVHISSEHSRYAWLPLEKAKKKLKHKNQIDLIDEVAQQIHA